jgi:hypothetical protein
MTSASNVQRFRRGFVTVVLLIAGASTALLLTLWAMSFIDFAGGPENCAFNSVTEDEYQRLLVQAKAQRWTVWPDLSNGIFGPSIQPSDGGTAKTVFGPAADKKLLAFIRELVPPESRSPDRELAATHALMRSIGAELVRISDVPRSQGHSSITFDYSMSQRRFAPLCLFCLIFQDTSVRVGFDRQIATGMVALDRVRVQHPKLDYHAGRAPKNPGLCPAFPPARIGR